MEIQTYNKKVDLVQPVEKVKPARPVYDEKKDEKREPETKDGGLDVLV